MSLRRAFRDAQTNCYIIEHDETARQTFFGMNFVVQHHATDELIERVSQVGPDGSAAIEWKLERVQFEKTDQKGTYRYDSAGGSPTSPESAPITALMTAGIRLRQSPCGVLEVNPPASATATATASAATTRPAERPGSGGYYDRTEYFQALARLSTEFAPPMPVSTGQSWHIRFERQMPAFGTLWHHMTYTLRSIEDAGPGRIAVIGVSGTCTLDPIQPPAAQPKTKVKVALNKGEWSGEIRFDLVMGRVETATLRHANDLYSDIDGGDKGVAIRLGQSEDRTVRVRCVEHLPARPILVQASRPSAPPRAVPRPPGTIRPRGRGRPRPPPLP